MASSLRNVASFLALLLIVELASGCVVCGGRSCGGYIGGGGGGGCGGGCGGGYGGGKSKCCQEPQPCYQQCCRKPPPCQTVFIRDDSCCKRPAGETLIVQEDNCSPCCQSPSTCQLPSGYSYYSFPSCNPCNPCCSSGTRLLVKKPEPCCCYPKCFSSCNPCNPCKPTCSDGYMTIKG